MVCVVGRSSKTRSSIPQSISDFPEEVGYRHSTKTNQSRMDVSVPYYVKQIECEVSLKMTMKHQEYDKQLIWNQVSRLGHLSLGQHRDTSVLHDTHLVTCKLAGRTTATSSSSRKKTRRRSLNTFSDVLSTDDSVL